MRVAVAVLGAALSLAACGKPNATDPTTFVTHDQVLKALSTNSQFAATTPAEQDCIANVLLQFEPAADLLTFVNGETPSLPEPADMNVRQEIVTGVSQCSLSVEASTPAG